MTAGTGDDRGVDVEVGDCYVSARSLGGKNAYPK
jgi:hypothetical protein